MTINSANARSSRARSAFTIRASSSETRGIRRLYRDNHRNRKRRGGSMQGKRYDLIVIGAGSAARDGANKAAREYGAKVALIERECWGGSCPNVACTPTKAYLVAADLAHDINTLADKLGIEVGPATTNLAKVRARKETLKKPQPKWVEDLQAAGFHTYEGTASFVDAHTIRVGDTE